MRRAGLLMLATMLLAQHASAQTFTRRRVPEGEVTGLEMGIEGTLSAVPGGRVHWYTTLYEVVRRRDLRISAGSTIRATASYAPAQPVAEVTTDAAGRAAIELTIPEDLEVSPHLVLEAISPRGVRRVFEVDLQLAPRFTVELFVDRDVAPPGGTITALGRVLDHARGAVAAEHEVEVRAAYDGPLGPPVTLTTDAAGAFSTTITMPALAERRGRDIVNVQAALEGFSASVGVRVVAPESRALYVAARPSRAVVAPGDDPLEVEVLVRTPEGLPIQGAQLEWEDEASLAREERTSARTDREGRAVIRRRLPGWIDAPWADHEWTLRAVHPAHGSASARVVVRVAREQLFATWAVEGAALVPGLEGRVLVRLVGADGAPLAGRILELDAPRLGGRRTATTDADGVALVSGTVGEPVAGERCGGPTAAAAELVVGEHRESLCLPVDPDATLTLRASPVSARRVAIELGRRPAVQRAPIVLSALVRAGERWAPIATVTAGPGETAATIELPEEVSGEVWLRARPILEGSREVRGGGALAWVGPAPSAFALAASEDGARFEDLAPTDTLAVFALEPERASALVASLRSTLGPVGAALDEERSEAFVRMVLATRTPRDEAVSAVLREGDVAPLPLPQEPARLGLLRDPWRTRARFVRGRVARLMRAVEQYVASHVPGALDDVAVREGRGYRFASEILDAALPSAGLGGEGAAALDGEPLDIAGLRAMDAAFTYDNVARRITRERLWRLSSMLRQLVRDRQLDRPWARRGDPAQYLVAMLEAQDASWQEWPERDHLFDAWGNPFALRPVRGRARFEFLEPVPGWEIVSGGPDGQLGTADDLADPFARVLPSGGLYAEAVGEDALLARLDGVALGRAMAESLGALFAVPEPVSMADDETVEVRSGALPPRIALPALGPVPVPAPREVLGGVGPAEAARAWTLPRERRRYDVVALRFSSSSPPSSAEAELVAGAPYAVRVELPSVMRPGEALSVPLSVVRLGDAPEPSVEVSARGALSIEREGERARITASRPGMAHVRVAVRMGDREVWSRDATVRVVPSGALHARHASALGDRLELGAGVPSGATPWRGSLVVRAPRALASDPMFAELRDAHPAPFAWASALRGEEVDPAMLAALTRAAGADGRGLGTGLEAACALSAWASAGELAPAAAVARALSSSVGDELADRAAILAALAPAAPGVPDGGSDPASALAVQLREDGWRALATTTDRPSVMARMAAALLVVDRQDAPGLALLARAREMVQRDAYGRPWVPGDAMRAGDSWIGTLALAIAARQAGEDALADELARAAATRLYLGARAGVEGAFWAVAASVYGAFGVDGPERVELVVDGAPRTLELTNGGAELALAPGASVAIRSARPLLARLEARFVEPPREEHRGPLTTRIEGDPGRAGDRSALELVVEGRGEEVGTPVVEVSLPGAAELDAAALAALRRSEAVRRVEGPDGAGVVRVHLAPLPAGATHRVPLPFRWIAAGQTRGLDVTAYDASRPWLLTTMPGRALEVEQ